MLASVRGDVNAVRASSSSGNVRPISLGPSEYMTTPAGVHSLIRTNEVFSML